MGRYSNYDTIALVLGPFSVSGAPKSSLGDVYGIDFTASLAKAGSVTLTASFGPQGRNFDSELSVAGGVEAELEDIGITLGGISFGSNTVSVNIAGQDFIYTRSQLDTLLVDQIIFLVGSPDSEDAAELAAEIIGMGMDALDYVDDFLEVGSVTMAPRQTFTARFIQASGFAVPDEYSTVATSGENFVAVLINEDQPTAEIYVYYRENPGGFPAASEIQSLMEEFPDVSIEGILLEFMGYNYDGAQYVFNVEDAIQVAFDNSFSFGSSDGNDDNIVDGTSAADVIDSSYVDPDGDTINDEGQTINGLDGDDEIYGGAGTDLIYGGAGDDEIYVATQTATIYGTDTAYGGDGDDMVIGSNGSNTLYGDAGDDYLFGGNDLDTADTDFLYGGDGNDILVSGQDVDPTVDRTDRGDHLFGEAGNDELIGGLADDLLDGGSGDDLISGGAGSDTFVFSAGDGTDTVTDFEAGSDLLDFSATGLSFSDLTITTEANGSTIVDYGSGDQIELLNTAGLIDQSDFVFV